MINKRNQAGMLGVDAVMALLVLSVLITLGSVWIISGPIPPSITC